MLSRPKTYWNYGTHYAAIEACGAAGEEQFFWLQTKLKKKEFVDFDFREAKSITKLKDGFSKNQHAFLVVNTANVLTRKAIKNESFNKMVSSAFPGMEMADFYVQAIQGKETDFIAVCRKDYVDDLLENFRRNNIEIIGFELGFSPIQKLVPELNYSEVLTTRHAICLEEGKIMSFSANTIKKDAYQLNDISITSDYLLSTASLFNYAGSTGHLLNFDDANTGLKRSFLEKNFFRKGLITGVAILLLTLVINFLFFNHYFKNQQQLQEVVTSSSNQRELFTLKLKKIEGKEQIVKSILSNGQSKSSKYINWMATQKPETVLFEGITYQPLSRAIRPDKPIEHQLGVLVVKGKSTSAIQFSTWIEKMETQDWLEQLTIKSFGADGGKDIFELELKIDHEPAK